VNEGVAREGGRRSGLSGISARNEDVAREEGRRS
jgi:hypothetical protein